MAEWVFSKDPCNLLGLARRDFDKTFQFYEDTSSQVSRVDPKKAARASWSTATIWQPEVNAPQEKSAHEAVPPVTKELLAAAWIASKPSAQP